MLNKVRKTGTGLTWKITWAAWLLTGMMSVNAQQPSADMEGGEAIRTLLVPRVETTLASQLNARIDEITRKPGEAFRRGETLVKFDCRLQYAQLAKARAQLRGAEKTHAANLKLQKFKAIGEVELAVSEAEVAKDKAEVQLYNVQAGLCRIEAPFNGRVVAWQAAPHATVSPGAPLLDILDDSHLEVQLHVPSHWLGKIQKGTQFPVRIEEIGETFQAEVERIGAKVDPVSRTIELYARILQKDERLLAGMSGVASFEQF